MYIHTCILWDVVYLQWGRDFYLDILYQAVLRYLTNNTTIVGCNLGGKIESGVWWQDLKRMRQR